MPNLVTQFSVDGTVAALDRRRTMTGATNDNRVSIGVTKSTAKIISGTPKAAKIENVLHNNSISSNPIRISSGTSVKIIGQSKYGSLPTKKTLGADDTMILTTTKLIDPESSSISEEEEDDEEGWEILK